MNRAKRRLINNIITMPDDFSEEAIVLQLLLKEPTAPYQTVPVSQGLDTETHNHCSD